MIPYVELHAVHLGPVAVNSSRVLVAVGILVGHLMLIRRARKTGRDPALAAALSLWMVLAGFAGAHLFKMLYLPDIGPVLSKYPWLAFNVFSGLASFGGIFAGLAGGLVYLRRRRLSASEALGYLDMVAYVFPFAWIFGRIGCALVHDHPGVWSSSWLAVRYPDGPRYDLGLLEVFYILLILTLFLLLDRGRPAGFYLALFLVLYGPFRLALDQLHVDVVRYLGWSVDQWAGAAAMLAGLGVWIAIAPMRRRLAAPGLVISGGPA